MLSPTSRDGDRTVFTRAVVVLAAAAAAAFLLVPPVRLIAAIADGSGYYLQIARNIAGGHGVTYDGIHSTNGFHPLWLAVLVPLFAAFRGTSETQFRLVGVLVVVLLAVASLLFHRTLRRAVSPPAALAGGLVFAAAASLNLNLMESALVLTTTSALFACGLSCRVGGNRRPTSSLLFGLLLGLSILSRLDLAFLAVAIGLVDLSRLAREPQGRREAFVRLGLIVLGASILVLPYLAYNQLAFGAVVPLSGRLESTLPRTNPVGLGMLRALGLARAVFFVPGVVYLSAYVLGARRRAAEGSPALRYLQGCAALLAAVSVVHTAHELLLMKWQLYWHSVMLIPLGAALAALGCQWLVERMPGRSARALTLAVVAPIVLLHGVATARRVRADLSADWRTGAYEAALFLRTHTPPDARIAMRIAEITGFFSERQIVDLEGLCNTVELQEAIRGGRLRAYLAKNAITYLVAMDFPESIEGAGSPEELLEGRYERGAVRIVSELFGTMSDPIPVRRADEVWRSRPYFGWGQGHAVVIFRVDLQGGDSG